MRKLLLSAAWLLMLCLHAAANPDPARWDEVLKEARGETVYFNAWGGDENINAYLEWAGGELEKRYGVKVVHVKLDDTANAVAKVVAEKAARRDEGGTVDLIWINGENFSSMKRQALLFSPGWADKLPNWKFVDFESKPTIRTDFSIPVDGLESPWGMAKLVFFYDQARTDAASVPKSARELLDWAKANPGRFSYPQPPDFAGLSFLKQVLSELAADRAVLQTPVDQVTFDEVAAPLFDYLDELNPLLWRGGKAFPQNYPAMKQLLGDERGGHYLRVQSGGSLERHRQWRAAGYSAFICVSRRDTGKYSFCGDPIQRRGEGRRIGARKLPDLAGGAGSQAGSGNLGRPYGAGAVEAPGGRQGPLREARAWHRHAQAGRTRSRDRGAASKLDGTAGGRVEAAVRRGKLTSCPVFERGAISRSPLS